MKTPALGYALVVVFALTLSACSSTDRRHATVADCVQALQETFPEIESIDQGFPATRDDMIQNTCRKDFEHLSQVEFDDKYLPKE